MNFMVLKAHHHAPFDGCFYQPQYWLAKIDGEHVVGLRVIYATGKKESKSSSSVHDMTFSKADEFYRRWLDESYEVSFDDWNFDNIEFLKLDDELDDDVDPNNTPTFWEFFNTWELKNGQAVPGYIYRWRCAFDGKLTDDQPVTNSGYSGNGGIGINYDGWISESNLYEYQYAQSLGWTEEVIRGRFSDWLPDNDDEKEVATKALAIMMRELDFDVCDSDDYGGRYPNNEIVSEALNMLGYSDPDSTVEVDPPKEYIDYVSQMNAGQLGFDGLPMP